MDFNLDYPQVTTGVNELLQIIRLQARTSRGEVPFNPDIGADLEDILFENSGNILLAVAKDVLNRFKIMDERFIESDLTLESDPDTNTAWAWLILPAGNFRTQI